MKSFITKYILQAGMLSIFLFASNSLFADCSQDTIRQSNTVKPVRLVIKADTIFTFGLNDSLISAVQADAVLPSDERLIQEEIRSRYDKRIHRYRKHWERIIPTHTTIQYAGNIGLLSIGTGWDYGKHRQWETNLLFGFIPKYSSKKAKITMTLKQSYIPWSIDIGKGFSVEPLSCGLYMNTVFGDQFWVSEPERYPKGYYGFSSKIRFHIFMGQGITFNLGNNSRFSAKAITLFYEISTCDLYLISAATNSYLKPKDYLSLSFGVKIQWF
mgnify:CR=1 FL=1